MSTTIKTNFNSSSNGCSLATLKKHINTCLERWQQKKSSKSHVEHKNDHRHHHQVQVTSQEEKCYCHFQEKSSGRFDNYSSKQYSFVQRTTVCWKSFNTRVQKFITPRQRVNKDNRTTLNDSEGPRKYGRKVEIVAKLLSSTLIAKTTSPGTTEEKKRCFETQIKKVIQTSSTTNSKCDFYVDKMTITDTAFLELREEYPDINMEIRSILTARAQEGATISQIRDDYRKLTGLQFPIYEDVTEFLLTIPHVTAYCSEKGTRIFNIRPMEKTKHIHEMVMHQKIQPEPLQKPKSINYYYRERLRNTNYQPSKYRQTTSRRLLQNYENVNVEPTNARDAEQQEQLIPSSDCNLSRDGSEVLYENNCFYQDNCNYLFNRICNQQHQEALTSQLIEKPTQTLLKSVPIPSTNAATSMALNNFNADMASYKNNVNHLNSLFQLQHPQRHQYQQHLNNLKTSDTRRPFHNPYKTEMPISISRSSSPTTKSWYTTESAYTDSDYEAHLLDFLLLGDDFLLYMARMELRCKFKKDQRVLQSGLCVSGQTIGASIKRIKAFGDRRRSVILNIGSVDIMQGRQLIQIEHDFRELLLTMLKKGITPILTTLAPIANYSHNNEVKRVLERFNDFIKREAQHRNLIVIDIWKCLVNEKGLVFFDCYQNEPRNVTGTSEPYLFWNKIGRQRVLQLIESKLEY